MKLVKVVLMFLTVSEFSQVVVKANFPTILFDYDGIFLHYIRGLGESSNVETLGSAVWKKALVDLGVSTDLLDQLLSVRQVKGAGAWPHIADRMAGIADSHGKHITGDQILYGVEQSGSTLLQRVGVDGVPLNTGSREYVDLLYQECNARMAIVTSCIDTFVEKQLALHDGMSQYFDCILGCRATQTLALPYKPDGDIWKYAVRQLQGDHIVIFEDNARNLVNALGAVPSAFGVLFTREDTATCTSSESEQCTKNSQESLLKIARETSSSHDLASRTLVIDPIFQDQGFKPLISELKHQLGFSGHYRR